jgi:hypothetical protein
VDVAVVDPRDSGRYLLGIECDGQPYAKAPTARDRDRLRHEVLEGLGWRLHRIWSIDWWFDQEREIRRLREALASAKEAPSAAASVPPEPLPTVLAASATEVPIAYRAEPAAVPEREGRLFLRAHLQPVTTLSTEDFFNFEATAVQLDQIRQVATVEAPLHLDDLARHLLTAWGWARLTERSRQRVETLVQALARKGELQLRGAFIWLPDQSSEAFTGHRQAAVGDEPRDADRIPPEEVAEAMRVVLQQNISLDREDLLRETARRFGFKRVSAKTTEALAPGIAVLRQRGGCEVDGSRIHMR